VILLYFLEFIFTLLFIVLMGTQVMWPLYMGTKTFPLFRHRKQEEQLTELKEQHAQLSLAEEVKRLGRELHQRRNDRQGEKE
jgi:hypothetical protein